MSVSPPSPNNYEYLYRVNSPEELKKLSLGELPAYCEEVRRFIIENLAQTPGHLASSLGAVELTVALHYVYEAPQDKIIWDVGHQAYTHKIITGRRDDFHTLRKAGGIAGFPRPSESEYDAFTAGHASNSISAALGFSTANKLRGRPEHVVAVIGDGAMSGGLAFEGLNNAGVSKSDLLVILNDNRISIDKGAGALKEYLVGITTSRKYNLFKTRVWNRFPPGSAIHNFLKKTANAIKHGILLQSNLFESFGFRYFGPVDGHDVISLVKVLRDLREIGGPKLLHTMTIKGRGYEPAEHDQPTWHAPGRFDVETGERAAESGADARQGKGVRRWDRVFGETLLELARKDERIVAITPAMVSGSGLGEMMKEMPTRVFDVGIAEAHAVTFAAGLAAGQATIGMPAASRATQKDAQIVPFCVIYSSFLQRAYDNIIHDVAIEGLGVVLCIDRGGLVGEDGTTHQGVFDLAALLPVPGLVIASPMDEQQMRNLMYTASKAGRPFVIRYPRGAVPGRNADGESSYAEHGGFEKVEIGRGRKLTTEQRPLEEGDSHREGGRNVALLSFGPVGWAAAEAAQRAQAKGVSVAHYDLRFAKPLDEELLHEVGARFGSAEDGRPQGHVITIEDGVVCGGVGSAVEDFFARNGYRLNLIKLGVGDEFVPHSKVSEQHAMCRLDADGILAAILNCPTRS